MASNSTISISFRIQDGADGLKTLAMDAKELQKFLSNTVSEAEKLNKQFVNFAAFAAGVSAFASSIKQLSDGLQQLTSESVQFEKAMRAANTMAGKEGAGFGQLKDQVADLAKEIPLARDLLANGLYQTISNGVPENNWMEFLNASARSAVGGIADINKVVGVTATVIKNYGLEWESAADIQDKIQLTAKNGVTSFEQLAQALPRVTGNAATLGVTIDELMGTFATLTGVSGNTAEVSTQLAAIFTALVKPSSEAAEMAAKMGVQFDAAAIQAAGGFQNFLRQLDQSIKAYAQATGTLEQEVYGRLFGSAEALRALIPLQGELADKFSANIAVMAASAGTMNSAFAEMGSTSEAETQKMRNQWATVTDFIASKTASIQPFITLASELTTIGASLFIVANGFSKLGIAAKITSMKTLAANGVFKILTVTSKETAAGLDALAASEGMAAKQAAVLKIGLRGLLAASVIGAAIVAVTAIIEHFANASDDAADSSKRLQDAMGRASSEIQSEMGYIDLLIGALKSAEEGTDEYRQAKDSIINQYGQYLTGLIDEEGHIIDLEAAYLRLAQAARESANARALKSVTEEAGQTYSDRKKGAMDGIMSVLNKKVKDQKQRDTLLEIIRRDFDRIGGLSTSTEDLLGKAFGEKRSERGRWNDASNVRSVLRYVAEMRDGKREYDKVVTDAQNSFGTMENEFKNWDKNMLEAAKLSLKQQIDAGETTDFIVTQNGKVIKTYKDVADARLAAMKIDEALAANQTPSHDTPKTPPKISSPKGGNKSSRATQSDDKSKYDKGASNLQGYRDNVAALNQELLTASKERAAEINVEIEQWQKLASEVENAGKKKPEFDEKASTLRGIGTNIDILREKLQDASEEEAAGLNQQIKAWEDKADAISNAGKEVEKTGPVFRTDAKSLNDIEENIRALQDDLGKTTDMATAANLNQQIEQWQKLADEIRNAGKEGGVTFDTFRSGWDGIKGIGGGIESITSALEGNGNAWQTVTGIVDGFLQIYDGIKTIIGIIDLLNMVTNIHTVTKTAEAAAVGASAGAQTAEAATSEASALAQAPVIAANKLAAKSYLELAAASYFAAHAYIPFAGFGIASGFVTAATSIVEGIGLLPFANGGIVSGPTIGLIGEYAGASGNPEVVAPLDKLRGMLHPVGQPVIVGGTLRASGRDIVCVLANETRIASKSGRRTNIKS